jgi:formylmethanofuran dehydrogenase subunit E
MKVRGTQETVKKIEQDAYRVYIRTNITRIDEEGTEENPGFHGWEYDEIEMPIAEYQEMIKTEVDTLKDADLDNKLALTEIYEMLLV